MKVKFDLSEFCANRKKQLTQMAQIMSFVSDLKRHFRAGDFFKIKLM